MIIVTSILYTIPSLALFEILQGVPGLRAERDDRRGGAGLLHAADHVPQHADRTA